MLDFVYYPVSAVLWLWHTGFATVLGVADGPAWALAIVCLVATLRVLLYRPFLAQVRFSRQLAVIQPRMRELQQRYADDRERLAAEVAALQREHRFNPLAGCLPVAAQLVMFIGLFHVLRSFDRTTAGSSLLPFAGSHARLTAAQNAATANYVFSPEQVQSFLHAKLLTAPLSATLATSGGSFLAVAVVAVPLAVLSGVMSHLTARHSITRQTAPTPQLAVINRMTLWLFPLGSLISGLLMPMGILVYFASNSVWTFVQQYLVHKHLGPVSEAVVVGTTTESPDD
ncbi:membrane protein insertase YidC [Nocardia stercoris]|uniref:Membrane protein insertase YidC n=1 Tax=Nocardia stercoris TaxID=2483361 RepID=A0A3M2LD05_9NOCA|nr:membrane protein insertase YidC [Nocardia stercoris]RMI32568.1 membrane protein insertase YidC [Nocardia stercoris]